MFVGESKPSPASAPAQPSTTSNVPNKSLIDLGVPTEPSTSSARSPPIPTEASSSAQPSRPPPPIQQKPQVKPPQVQATPQAHQTESGSDISETVKGLALKRDQYKLAARNSNRDGDKEAAKTYLLISKVLYCGAHTCTFVAPSLSGDGKTISEFVW